MKLYGNCLVLVADGTKARLFEERRRGGPLVEITARLGDQAPAGPIASGHAGRVHDRHGAGSHTTGGPSPREKQETAFITRLADRIGTILLPGAFEDLVVIAPPRALGQLRQALSPGALHRMRASDAHDRVSSQPDEIRAALAALRLRPASPD